QFYLSLGAEGAYSLLQAPSTELDKRGYLIGVRPAVEFRRSAFRLQAGLGWQSSYLDRSQSTGSILAETVKSTTPFLDLNARYQVFRYVGIGPRLMALIGDGVSF